VIDISISRFRSIPCSGTWYLHWAVSEIHFCFPVFRCYGWYSGLLLAVALVLSFAQQSSAGEMPGAEHIPFDVRLSCLLMCSFFSTHLTFGSLADDEDVLNSIKIPL